MNKIELVTLRHFLDCETARLTHERSLALHAASDDTAGKEAPGYNALPLPETVSAYCDAVDLLLSLKTAPGPDLPEEEYRTHAAAQMLLDLLADLYGQLDAAMDDDNVLSDTTRCHVDALRQELVRERINAAAAELAPLLRQLAIPNIENFVPPLLEELNRHLSAESDSAAHFSDQAAEMDKQNLPSHAGRLRRMAERHETIAAQLRVCIASLHSANAADSR